MNNYSNPMVTYNEIIEALKAILDCSRTNGYLDDYSFLNARYDVLNKSPLYEEQEQALIQAIQSLEKTIDAADKVIRENLKDVLNQIVTSNSFIIPTRYKKDEEYRKLAAQDEFVVKLKEMSLPLEVLSDVPVSEVPEKKESLDEIESLVEPFEEVEIESLNVPASEEPEEDIYYSKGQLGNVKNAFAVTEEQYQKLKSIQTDEEKPEEKQKEGIESLDTLPSDVMEPQHEVKEERKSEDDFATSELPLEKPLPVETVEEEKVEVASESKEEVEQSSSEQKKASLDRIKLIKKALDKAKEKGNAQLIKILEQQLRKEVEALKS